MQASSLFRSCRVSSFSFFFIRSSHRGPLIKSTVLIRIELRATCLGQSSNGGLNPIGCNLSSVSDCGRWFRNQRFKIVPTDANDGWGLIWALPLNQQSCPAETLDKQRLSFCLGCGAERYVLSGDCAPPPPLILRGRTHTERPCEERRGLGGRAKGSSRHAAGATQFWSFHTDATVPHSVLHYCRLQSNSDYLKLLFQILVPFLVPLDSTTPHKSIHKPVNKSLLMMVLIFHLWFN